MLPIFYYGDVGMMTSRTSLNSPVLTLLTLHAPLISRTVPSAIPANLVTSCQILLSVESKSSNSSVTPADVIFLKIIQEADP